jgi:Xaa-Pro aminopeptidase
VALTSPASAVPAQEFKDRQARVVEQARERGLDAVLVWSRGGTSVDFYGDVLYLTGHHSPFPPNQDTTEWSGRSYSAAILPVHGEPALVLDLPDHDPDALHVDDIRSVIRVPQTAAAILRERGVDADAIGLAGRDTFLLSHLRAMEAELGHPLELVDADDILERLRLVKSEHEIPHVRRASAVGNVWMRTMMEAIEPGRTEGEVVGEGLRALAAAGGFPYDAAIASGDRSRNFLSRYSIPSWDAEKRLAAGDIAHIDAWGSIDGYFCDLDRSTVVGGNPSGAQRELLEASIAIIEHIIAGVRPGATIGELYDRGAGWLVDNGFGEHRAKLEDAGTDFGQLFPAFGHSVGLGLERPYIIKGDPTVVEENMVLAVETLIGRREVGGAAFEQTMLVTADGADVLNADCPSRWWT